MHVIARTVPRVITWSSQVLTCNVRCTLPRLASTCANTQRTLLGGLSSNGPIGGLSSKQQSCGPRARIQ